MTTKLTDIISLCAQRKTQQLFNVPPPRVEIVSPYENNDITKFQLDMRRKAEVLKYDQGNTKTNSFTKKQLWTKVVNGKSQLISTSFILKNNTTPNLPDDPFKVLNCNNPNESRITSSSASDVPRDYINGINALYLDSTVPLYNYINPVLTRSYGFTNPPLDTSVIRYSNYINVMDGSPITTVEFTEATTNSQYTLSLLNIPVAIQVYGDISGTNVDVTLDSIVIKKISLRVKFNDSIVEPINVYNTILTPINNRYSVNVQNDESSNNETFSGTKYIGNLNITNVVLYSSPGYMYTFELVYEIDHSKSYETGSDGLVLSNITATGISNVTNSYLLQNSPYNCTISFPSPSVTPTLPDSFNTFNIVAV